jgi:hypothetical protein
VVTAVTRHGPTVPCERSACVDKPAHVGGAHLDPASEQYDGPDTALAALPGSCRRSAQTLLHAAREHGWDRRVVETALHELAREILDMRGRMGAAIADKARGIREAMARAEDCAVHGEMIRSEGHQAHYFSVLAEQHDAERVAWLSAAHSIRAAFAERDDPLAAAVVRYVDDAGKTADRARKRFAPPTFADCERAGRCEHPATVPHAACEQLRLDITEAA